MNCLTPYYVRGPNTWKDAEFNFLPVPCGKCALCKARKRREWTFRISEEMATAHYTAFATLTYRERDLPTVSTSDADDVPTLRYSDVQKFLKRFRKRLNTYGIKLRYFICGEYGSNTLRPHYHCIFFFRGETSEDVLSIVALLPKMFRDSWLLGDILDFQQCKSNGSSSYCNKYLNKFYKVELLDEQNPEKSLKSQNIGRDYIDKMKSWYLADPENRHYAIYEGYKIGLPRTFKQKIFGETKNKKTTEEINKLYRDMYDREIDQIQHIKERYYDTYGTYEGLPELKPFAPSTPQEIKEINDYITHVQSKDKF